jgi:hypothetical protein
VIPRPLRWKLSEDRIGAALRNLYGTLARLRLAHPALRSAQMYPEVWPDFRRSQAHEGLIDRVGAGQGGAVRP